MVLFNGSSVPVGKSLSGPRSIDKEGKTLIGSRTVSEQL